MSPRNKFKTRGSEMLIVLKMGEGCVKVAP